METIKDILSYRHYTVCNLKMACDCFRAVLDAIRFEEIPAWEVYERFQFTDNFMAVSCPVCLSVIKTNVTHLLRRWDAGSDSSSVPLDPPG